MSEGRTGASRPPNPEKVRSSMTPDISFKGYTVVSCGTLRRELNHLRETGFLDADGILYTVPGLHERIWELEDQLKDRLSKALERSTRVIVVYGSRCYLRTKDERSVDDIIEEVGGDVVRIDAKNCIDALASYSDLKRLAGGENPYWLTSGWLDNWKLIFKDWDMGLANETFPKHGKALLLDPLGVFEEYAMNKPETLLEFSDWMGIPIEPQPVGLDRFKHLLEECVG